MHDSNPPNVNDQFNILMKKMEEMSNNFSTLAQNVNLLTKRVTDIEFELSAQGQFADNDAEQMDADNPFVDYEEQSGPRTEFYQQRNQPPVSYNNNITPP